MGGLGGGGGDVNISEGRECVWDRRRFNVCRCQ